MVVGMKRNESKENQKQKQAYVRMSFLGEQVDFPS